MGANGHISLNFFESVDAPLTSRYYSKKEIILFLLTLHWKKGHFTICLIISKVTKNLEIGKISFDQKVIKKNNIKMFAE